ncbi:glycosyltransferase family 4 protein [Streptacidiphilus cavernicola]|uniref:Glycosyltransferase family 4 protein n=1 Tax=Streptacidiphilus cavernicola TaxID=3342716 RepID=A0ABV6W1X3_9ACTN
MPLTILHVSQPVDGGVARVVVDLLRGQVADGHRVLLACPAAGPLAAAATAVGAEVLPWTAVRAPGAGLPGEVRALRGLVAAHRPQLVHLHSSKAGLAGRLALRGSVPTVFQPHAWSFAAVSGPMARLARGWERLGARWTDRLLCVSEAERAEGVAAGLRGRWALAPNGVDLAYFDPVRLPLQEQARQQAAESLGLPGPWPEGPLAVCVGRLCRQKGQDVLLRAWGPVPERVPGARLVLVGDGPERAALEALAATLPDPSSVVFAGPAEDPRDWYAAADLVVLPSRWEGMALVPLEAMACGCPVLLTEVAGARECLDRGEQPVPVDDPEALREALVARLADPVGCLAAGARARSRMVERHDVEDTVAKVTAVYRSVLEPLFGVEPEKSPVRMTAGKSD